MDMATRHHEQRLFFSTGRRHGEGVDAIDGLGLRPGAPRALPRPHAPALRLSAGAGRPRSRGGHAALALVGRRRGAAGDRAARASTASGCASTCCGSSAKSARCSRGGARGTLTELWAEAAPRLAAPGDPSAEGVLTHIADKLQLDGEVVDCDRAMPARVLTHVWQAAQQRKGKAFRTIVERLVIKLSDILRAAFIHSAGRAAARGAARVAGRHPPRRLRLRRDVAARRAATRRRTSCRRRGAAASRGRSRS